ncbi:MAG: HAMP domain-containing histidine kinase [Bacilli bacterium]|nr:HAMP domain-containing histidine kinase [Bacilli bacterium]
MIKKLRRKFILISALSVFFVLAVTIGAINISNYVSIENNSKNILTEVIKEGPKQELDPLSPPEQNNINLRQEHYFVVTFNADGTIKETDNRQMFILTKEECNDLATKVYNGEITGRKYGNFRFQKEKKSDGLTYVGFVDIKERLDSSRSFLLTSSLVSVGAYLVLIGLIVVASKIAFKSSEEAYKKQKRFITNASHELKTPITVISADLDLIEMDNGKSEWSQSIRDQLARLTEMTNQLVTLSRLEEEDPSKYPFDDFSLNEVSKNAVDAFKTSFKKENIKFSYNITGNLTMFGNKFLINELITIMLDNSLKYTGGENKSSYFVVSENKNKIELRFSNTIDKNDEVDTKQILERFYRSPSNKKEGSGIGLSIVQEIVNLHKGKIKVDKNNSSLTFFITFD